MKIVANSQKSREEREKGRKRIVLVKRLQFYWRGALELVQYRQYIQSHWVYKDKNQGFDESADQRECKRPASIDKHQDHVSEKHHKQEPLWHLRVMREFLFFTRIKTTTSPTPLLSTDANLHVFDGLDTAPFPPFSLSLDLSLALREISPVLLSQTYLELVFESSVRDQWIGQVSQLFGKWVVGSLAALDFSNIQEWLAILISLTSPVELLKAAGKDVQYNAQAVEIIKNICGRLVNEHDALKKLVFWYIWHHDHIAPQTTLLAMMSCTRLFVYHIYKVGIQLSESRNLIQLFMVQLPQDLLLDQELSSASFESIFLALNTINKANRDPIIPISQENYQKVLTLLSNLMQLYKATVHNAETNEILINELIFYLESFHQFSINYRHQLDMEEDDAEMNGHLTEIHTVYARIQICRETLSNAIQTISRRTTEVFTQQKIEELIRSVYSETSEWNYAGFVRIANLLYRLKKYSKFSIQAMQTFVKPLIELWPTIQQSLVNACPTKFDAKATLLALFCESYEYLLASTSSSQKVDQQEQDPILVIHQIQFLFFFQRMIIQRINHVTHLSLTTEFIEFMVAFNSLIRQLKRHSNIHKSICNSVSIETLDPALLADDTNSQSLIRKYCPNIIPPLSKVMVLYSLIKQDKEANNLDEPHWHSAAHHISIRRGTKLLSDAFQKLNPLKEKLKDTIKIEFLSEDGIPEPGIDGGGLLRELLSEVMKLAFSPDYGLFLNTDQNQLYPNPLSSHFVEDDTRKFTFLGRLLGKCIYEMISVDLPLAPFFLSQILGYLTSVDDLKYLDQELYQGVQKLLDLPQVDDLGLTFVTTSSIQEQYDLVPGGSKKAVTLENRAEFVRLLAEYKLSLSIKSQSHAFLRGLTDIIQLDWFKMFDEEELRMVMSSDGRLDLSDLKANVVYRNGYHGNHATVMILWEVLDEFSDHQLEDFFKFVTAMTRPPILGFSALNPKLCITMIKNPTDFLPTSNTCFNLLKLPPYNNKELLRDKLLYAINSGARFELS